MGWKLKNTIIASFRFVSIFHEHNDYLVRVVTESIGYEEKIEKNQCVLCKEFVPDYICLQIKLQDLIVSRYRENSVLFFHKNLDIAGSYSNQQLSLTDIRNKEKICLLLNTFGLPITKINSFPSLEII